MLLKIYTQKQVHVCSVRRHCVPSQISAAIRYGAETMSMLSLEFLQSPYSRVVITVRDTVLGIFTDRVYE